MTHRRCGAGIGMAIAMLLACSAATGRAFAADPDPGGTAVGDTAGGADAGGAGAPAPGVSVPLDQAAAGTPESAAGGAFGVAVRLGDPADAVAAADALGGAPLQRPPGLTVTPSLGVQEEYTTDAFRGTTPEADFITSATPGLLVNLATPEATGTLSYAPTFQLYAHEPSEDNVGQQLNGALDATLLPQTLLLSMRAYASEQSTTGGVAPGGTSTLSTNNRTTTTGFFASPRFQHHFGDAGTLVIGYSLAYTEQSGNAAFAPGAATPFFLGSRTLTNEEDASFTTGPDLGRFNDTLAASGTENSGTGVLDGAHQSLVSDTLRYAVLRRVYAFGTLGYENIAYASLPPIAISDGVWAGGVQLTPQGSDNVTLGYGHFYGFDAPFAHASLGLSARTRLAVSYSDVLASSQQLLQQALGASTVDPAGNPVDSQSNFPVLLTNQLLGVQSGISRISQLSASLITAWPRDTLSLSFLSERQKLVADAPGTAGFSQDSLSGSLGWTHGLTPTLSLSSYAQMGETTSQALGSGVTPVFAGSLSLIDRLSPSLTASLQYQLATQSLNDDSGTITIRNQLASSVILALRKTF